MSDVAPGNPGACCPECGAQLDDWTPVEGRPHPREGSVGGCLYCGTILVYRADLTLRKPTGIERAEILRQMPEVDAFFERVTAKFKKDKAKRK